MIAVYTLYNCMWVMTSRFMLGLVGGGKGHTKSCREAWYAHTECSVYLHSRVAYC